MLHALIGGMSVRRNFWIALLAGGLVVPALAGAALAQSDSKVATAPSVAPPDVPLPAGMTRNFDGKSLEGWVQEPINATAFSGGDIVDAPGLAGKLVAQSDPDSAYLTQ